MKIKLLIYTRPNLRNTSLEYEMFIGRDVLISIFDKMEMRPDVKGELFLSFPEHWLNILEQRALYARLRHYCPNLESVLIKTHSVYIVQCTRKSEAGIVDVAGSIPENTPITEKLWIDVKSTNIFDGAKLNVL